MEILNSLCPKITCISPNPDIGQVVGHYHNAKADLARYDRATQDILHALELAKNEIDGRELMLLMKELREVRIQR
jgi:hypothetical protein